MTTFSSTQRWGCALILPFVIQSAFLVLAENVRSIWPQWFGEIQEAGLIVGAITGLLFLPRLPWPAKIETAALYLLGLLPALFIFAFWFIAAVYGDAL